MSKKTHYTDEPLGELRIVPDFLPHPDELETREEIEKGELVSTAPTKEEKVCHSNLVSLPNPQSG